MGALAAYTESVRRLRGILARLERHGAHAEASQLAAIVRPPHRIPSLLHIEKKCAFFFLASVDSWLF